MIPKSNSLNTYKGEIEDLSKFFPKNKTNRMVSSKTASERNRFLAMNIQYDVPNDCFSGKKTKTIRFGQINHQKKYWTTLLASSLKFQ